MTSEEQHRGQGGSESPQDRIRKKIREAQARRRQTPKDAGNAGGGLREALKKVNRRPTLGILEKLGSLLQPDGPEGSQHPQDHPTAPNSPKGRGGGRGRGPRKPRA